MARSTARLDRQSRILAHAWAAALSTLFVACGGPIANPDADGAVSDAIAADALSEAAAEVGPPALAPAPGEALELVAATGPVRVRLATPTGSERHVVIIGSTDLSGNGGAAAYRARIVEGSSTAPDATARTLAGCAITPDRWRAMMLPVETPPSGMAPAVGTERMFTVPVGAGSEVITARAIAVGERAVVWADVTAAHPANMDPAFVAEFLRDFDNVILPRERTVFGMESDIDGDGRIALLFTSLTYRTAVAYFRGCDIVQFPGCRVVNRGEILYLTPPSAIPPPYNTPAAIKETLAHELGHLIHFGRKVLRNRLASWADNSYLVEGIGALAQDTIGYQSGNLYVTLAGLNRFGDFSLGDILVDGAPYDPMRDGLLRGDAYLFVRWLYDRAGGDMAASDGTIASRGGPALLRTLMDSPRSITRELQMVTMSPELGDVAMDFFTAVGLSNRERIGDVAATNPCFRYLPVQADPITMRPRGADLFASFHGMMKNGPETTPIAMADGSVTVGGAEFLLVEAVAGQREVSFEIDVDATAMARVRIARVR